MGKIQKIQALDFSKEMDKVEKGLEKQEGAHVPIRGDSSRTIRAAFQVLSDYLNRCQKRLMN